MYIFSDILQLFFACTVLWSGQTIMFAKWLSTYMHSLLSFVWSLNGKTHHSSQAFAFFLPLSFCFSKGAGIYSVRLSKSTWSWLLIRKKQWYQVSCYLDSRRLKISSILTNSSPKLFLWLLIESWSQHRQPLEGVLFISTTAEPRPELPSDQSGQSWSSRSWLVSGDRSPYGDTTTGAFSVIKWPISTLTKLHQIV